MSLESIGELSATVTIRGKPIEVGGLTNNGVRAILMRFPAVKKWLSGNATVEEIMEDYPDAVAAIIAAATGNAGSKKHETIAAGLTIGETIKLMEKIIPFTMPDGLGPFVMGINAIGAALAGPQALSDGKSNPAGTSQGASKRSLPAGIERKTSGK